MPHYIILSIPSPQVLLRTINPSSQGYCGIKVDLFKQRTCCFSALGCRASFQCRQRKETFFFPPLLLNSQQEAGQSRGAVGSGLAQGCLMRRTPTLTPSPPLPALVLEGSAPHTILFCFQIAVLNNHEQLVQLLLDKGADASVKNEVMFIGRSPFEKKDVRETRTLQSVIKFCFLPVWQRCPRNGQSF